MQNQSSSTVVQTTINADHHNPKRSLGLWDAISTIVGIILGSGIFRAPSHIAAVFPNPISAAAVWFCGGIIAIFGAMCYAECGARLPHNGGFVVFYEKAYGKPCARLAGFLALLMTYPASLAGIAMVGGSYFTEALSGTLPFWQIESGSKWPAFVLLALATLLNLWGARLSAISQKFLSTAKIIALFSLTVAALCQPQHFENNFQQPWMIWHGFSQQSAEELLLVFAILMWTLDGWTDVTMIAGEIKNPQRDLGRAAIFGLLLVSSLYALIQFAVLLLLPHQQAAQSPQVVSEAVGLAFGPLAQSGIAWLITFILFGALHSCVMVLSRLVGAMAEQGGLPKILKNPDPSKPHLLSVALVTGLGSLYLLVHNFQSLVSSFSFVVWLFYGFTALTLLRLRHMKLGEPLIYHFIGGAASPYVLLTTATVMTALQWKHQPIFVGSTLLVIGLVALWLWLSRKRGTTTTRA